MTIVPADVATPTDYTDNAAAAAPTEAPGQHAADLQAEVATELDRAGDQADDDDREYPEGAVAVPLDGAGGRRGVVHILPPDEWPSDANSALHVSDFESWAEGCLALDDYEAVWSDLRPTLGQVNHMFEEWRRISGQAAGKSRPSPASLRRGARR